MTLVPMKKTFLQGIHMRNMKVLPPFKSYDQPQSFFVDKLTNRQMGQKLSTGNPAIYRSKCF